MQARKTHSHIKRSRDSLRQENRDLRLEGALLCHPNLLLDLEHKIDAEEYTRKKLHQLKQTYADCKMTSSKIRKKIDTFRAIKAEKST